MRANFKSAPERVRYIEHPGTTPEVYLHRNIEDCGDHWEADCLLITGINITMQEAEERFDELWNEYGCTVIEQLKQRNAELTEQVKQTRSDMESMRAEFRTRLAEVISKSGIKFDKGSLNNPYEWKPLLLVVTGLYYEHDGVVKRCIDGGIAKDFETRFEAV